MYRRVAASPKIDEQSERAELARVAWRRNVTCGGAERTRELTRCPAPAPSKGGGKANGRARTSANSVKDHNHRGSVFTLSKLGVRRESMLSADAIHKSQVVVVALNSHATSWCAGL